MCGAEGSAEGAFDPAHLIPAQMIRREARATPALGDYVYLHTLAVWACRGCHFQNDYIGTREPTITREVLESCGAWPDLTALASEMDRLLLGREPFAVFVATTYP